MGQHAGDAIMAEMLGMDVEDYLVGQIDLSDYKEDPAADIQCDLGMMLGTLENLKDDEAPPTSAEILQELFPELTPAEAVEFERIAVKIRHMELEDRDEDENPTR